MADRKPGAKLLGFQRRHRLLGRIARQSIQAMSELQEFAEGIATIDGPSVRMLASRFPPG
jgi:hypothetical protein